MELFGFRMPKDEYVNLLKFSLKLGLCPQADEEVSGRWLAFAETMLQ